MTITFGQRQSGIVNTNFSPLLVFKNYEYCIPHYAHTMVYDVT